jgi:hypothetical protein
VIKIVDEISQARKAERKTVRDSFRIIKANNFRAAKKNRLFLAHALFSSMPYCPF